MEVIGPDQCEPPPGGTAVTIGAYDGVHLGHRALLGRLVKESAARGLMTAVVTFDRHPATVVRPESAPAVLTDLEQKLELLADCGIDRTVVIPFDEARAAETAEAFVGEILITSLDAKLIVVGEDFHFGQARRGNVALLTTLGGEFGFEVEGVGLTDMDSHPISSTRIRALVAEGDVAEAALLLGHLHQVRGTVVHGDGRGGAVLGFPTANVEVPSDLALPGDGIYAGYYDRPDGTRHKTAISVGRRPTFYENADQSLVEAYLLDFDGDLYGERARVSFSARLRAEQRFDSIDELVAQMHRDVDQARSVLQN